jgi:hypothetical protein
MEEMAASNSRWRAALALEASVDLVSTASLSEALGGIKVTVNLLETIYFTARDGSQWR